MNKKILEKAFKEDNFNLLKETYSKEELNQIPHLIISEQLNIKNPVELCRWLFKNGVDYNAKDQLGNTGLMIACFMKNKAFVELYLSLDIDTNPDEGITPLMLSLEGLVDEEIVYLLLKTNADVDKITTYNNTKISAVSLAYQNTNNILFKNIIKKSKNIIKHYRIIEKLPSFNTNKKNKYELDIAHDEYLESFFKLEPLKSLEDLITKYELYNSIETVILNDESKKIKCINEEKNEYIYEDKNAKILFKKDDKTEELTFIDIFVNEEIIYPKLKKEREQKRKEEREKLKKYNDSFKIDLGYNRKLDNLKLPKEEINKEQKVKERKKVNKESSKYKPNDYYKYDFNNIEREILKLNKQKSNLFKYNFEYLDENDFRKKERSVKKYNMRAYKKLTFEYYPELHQGNALGREVHSNAKDAIYHYELELPTDELFRKVHGTITLHYTICDKNNTVLLTNITPENILDEGHRNELVTYKGVMVSKSNADKDMFKINLLNMLSK